MAQLTGPQVTKLSTALDSAMGMEQLKEFVYASTGDQLFASYVGEGKPKRVTIYELIIKLEEIGATNAFLHYVYLRRDGRPDVQDIIKELAPEAVDFLPDRKIPLSVQLAGAEQADDAVNALAPGFQKNVRPFLARLDIRTWLTRILEIELRVCRVEIGDRPLGTGFLVGPDAVLTNWHVIKSTRDAGNLDKLSFRFDYQKLPGGGSNPGKLIQISQNGLLCGSSYSRGEDGGDPDNPPPTPDELDYALLRLQSPVDNKRGCIILPDAQQPMPVNAPILIVQHPLGEPMKLAIDTNAVIGKYHNDTRLRYRTNTERGSSGSPCFTMDWDLVALHHYGDPAYTENPKFNQGVPISLVRKHIVASGHEASLCS